MAGHSSGYQTSALTNLWLLLSPKGSSTGSSPISQLKMAFETEWVKKQQVMEFMNWKKSQRKFSESKNNIKTRKWQERYMGNI